MTKKNEREELAKLEKELIFEQSDNEDFFKACGKPVHDVHVHITIPAKGVALKKLFEAEKLLRAAGVSFDTGCGCGGRDWEFDWSLKGAHVKLCKVLTKEEQICNMFYRILQNGYSGEEDFLPCGAFFESENNYLIVVYGKREIFEKTLQRKLKTNFKKFKIITVDNSKTPVTGNVIEAVEKEDETIGYRCNGIFVKVAYTQNSGGY